MSGPLDSETIREVAKVMNDYGLRMLRLTWPKPKHEGNRHERRRAAALQRRAARRAR